MARMAHSTRFRPASAAARILGLGVALAGLARGSSAAELAPAWVFEAPGLIAWAESVPASEPATILLSTPKGLIALDARHGTRSTPQPLLTSPDVRAARVLAACDAAPLRVVFDRHAIWGVNCAAEAQVAWRFDDDAVHRETHRGDPESLPRWIDAGTTETRVLALNADGRAIWLERQTGRLLARAELGPLPAARVAWSARCAAALWTRGGTAYATLLPFDAAHAAPAIVSLGRERYTWAALADETLVALAAGRTALVSGAGVRAGARVETSRPLAGAVCIWQPPSADNTATQPASDSRILAVLRDRDVVLASAETGRIVWSEPLLGLESAAWTRFEQSGGRLLIRQAERLWIATPLGAEPALPSLRSGRVAERLEGDTLSEYARSPDGAMLEVWQRRLAQAPAPAPIARLRGAGAAADAIQRVEPLRDGWLVVGPAWLARYATAPIE